MLSLSKIAQQAQPTGGGIIFLLVMFIIFVVVLVMVWYALRGKRISSQPTEEQVLSSQSRDAEDHVEAGVATEEPPSESAPAADVDRRKLLPPVPAETPAEDAAPTGAPSATPSEVEQAEESPAAPLAEPTDGEQKSDEKPASPGAAEHSGEAASPLEATDPDTATAADDETRVAIAVPAADAEQPADAVPDSPAAPDEVVADAPSTVDESQARPAEEPVQQTEPEVVAPTSKSTVADEDAASIPAAAPVDNLKRVEGIGPKIASVLAEAGITSFAQLAAMTPEQISAVLEGQVRLAVPDTWPEQAKLAAEDKWDELRKFQSQLKGGRRV